MPNITFQFNATTANLERVIQADTPAPVVEVIDITGLNGQVQTLTEQIAGYNQRITEAQAQADATKADMQNRIADAQKQIDDLTAQKTAIYSAVPDLDAKLNAATTTSVTAQPAQTAVAS